MLLILSNERDEHSQAALKALKKRNIPTSIYDQKKFIEEQLIDISINSKSGFETSISGFDINNVKSIWNRRPTADIIVPDYIHKDDTAFVYEQCRFMSNSVLHTLNDRFWANNHQAALLSEHKPIQLHVAKKCGFSIPDTLISNNPDKIRDFINGCGSSIYKPLVNHQWHEGDDLFSTYVEYVTEDCLPSEALLKAAPGIFQKEVEKSYEVRLFLIGRQCFAVKIDSAVSDLGRLDWRYDGRINDNMSALNPPDQIILKCKNVLDSLGLVCGSFDFIVNKSDDWIFLEVNQSGQFLFIEEAVPELPVLDAFVGFLLARDGNYKYSKSSKSVKLLDCL